MTRPLAIIDWTEVDNLLMAGCSGKEIAGHIGINCNTLYERCTKDKDIPFGEYSQQKYAKGESLIKAKQFQKALGECLDGDNTLLIWLGKVRCEQRESKEETRSIVKEELASFLALIKAQSPVKE
jgi:hypothetical protein